MFKELLDNNSNFKSLIGTVCKVKFKDSPFTRDMLIFHVYSYRKESGISVYVYFFELGRHYSENNFHTVCAVDKGNLTDQFDIIEPIDLNELSTQKEINDSFCEILQTFKICL